MHSLKKKGITNTSQILQNKIQHNPSKVDNVNSESMEDQEKVMNATSSFANMRKRRNTLADIRFSFANRSRPDHKPVEIEVGAKNSRNPPKKSSFAKNSYIVKNSRDLTSNSSRYQHDVKVRVCHRFVTYNLNPN